MHLTSHHRSQTLLEAVMAIGIILISTVSSTTLIVTTITAGQTTEDRIQAANFAREGIEIVREIRDSNWLRRAKNDTTCTSGLCDWDSSLTPGGSWMAFYNPSNTDPFQRWSLRSYVAAKATISLYQSGLQSYYTQDCASCTATKFRRQIVIDASKMDSLFNPNDTPYLDVTVTVTWDNHGTKTERARSLFYNWR